MGRAEGNMSLGFVISDRLTNMIIIIETKIDFATIFQHFLQVDIKPN